MLRKFEVSAIELPIVYNRYGDVDPNGLMYVLEENEKLVKELVCKCTDTYINLVQPLVIRANLGDIVEIKFTNKLCFPASMSVAGLSYDIMKSDGSEVGNNENSVADPNQTLTYRWKADVEGCFKFMDLGNTLSSEIGSNVHGLFGAIVVEAPGSYWTDPQTGCELKSGVFADVHNPFIPDFREFVTIFHDEAPVKNRFLETPAYPMSGAPAMTHSINYRSEPMRNRMNLIMEGLVCPGCEGEEVHHDSWAFGDPPETVLPRAYVADPVRWHVVHGASKETHIFHLHLHQWHGERKDPDSRLTDSRGLSPGEVFSFDILYGAGSLQKAYGDVIYHCHLYPHFDEGMWGIFRVHDVLEDGSRCYPDGSPVTPLVPLPDRKAPRRPTPERPGFPFFIPGKVGCKSPVPPIGWERNFPITQLEKNALDPNWKLGALFTNPCPKNAPIRRYDVVAIQMPLIYNTAGWNDPEGRFYVLAEDEYAVTHGLKKPEPLFIRAQSGECVEIHFTNKLPEQLGPNAFQDMVNTLFCSTHVHFVKFDPLSSDGSNVGWNYFTGAAHNQTVVFRWYADVELKTVFFHDHLFANSHQNHGLYGGLIVEPSGSEFFDSFTGKPMNAGAQAIVTNPFLPDFREFCLAVQDWTPQYAAEGIPIEPPDLEQGMEDRGVMAFNYTNEPFQIRGGDPAYVFSSYVHGDPYTPVFQGYAGDPVRLRLIDGAHEESHAININRYWWRNENENVNSEKVQSRHIGISEAFTFQFNLESQSGRNDFDVLYYSGGMDDLWIGLWGLIRVRGTKVPFLKKLPDRKCLSERTEPLPVPTGCPPKKAVNTEVSNPCKPYKRIVKVHVAAVHAPIAYNRFGDNDPYGMVFVPYELADKVIKGEINPEPFILTINSGDYVELTLTNMMPKCLDVPQFPEVPAMQKWPYSPKVSMHTQFAVYDPLYSDGTTVGFNPDQTVDVGESITYSWYYPDIAEQAIVVDFGDVMNHRRHGLFGAISIAEPGSRHRNSCTGQMCDYGAQLDILNKFIPSYRQFVLLQHNGIYLEDKDGKLLPRFFFNPELGPASEEFDEEDQGMKGFNLRSEPYLNRLEENPCISEVFSKESGGLPSTPIFNAYAGDPITVKLLMPADKPRAVSFTLHAHVHREQSDDLKSDFIGTEGEITVGNGYRQEQLYGAGGLTAKEGDYMYRSGSTRWDMEEGMWGFIRVLGRYCEDLKKLNDDYR